MRGCLTMDQSWAGILAGELEIEYSPHWASCRTGAVFRSREGGEESPRQTLSWFPRRFPRSCYNRKFPMASIHPFRAVRYQLQRVSASQVVTQPYDKITPALQERYYAASPYNLVRIILGRREANDNTENNVYSRAAASFRDWRRQGILRQDAQPSLYAYSQRFKLPGSDQELERRRSIALGRIEDYSAGVVF